MCPVLFCSISCGRDTAHSRPWGAPYADAQTARIADLHPSPPQRHGVSPSFDEMKDALDLKSKSGIHRLITGLEERGFIRRLPHRARALEVVRLPEDGLRRTDRADKHFAPKVIQAATAARSLAAAPKPRRQVASCRSTAGSPPARRSRRCATTAISSTCRRPARRRRELRAGGRRRFAWSMPASSTATWSSSNAAIPRTTATSSSP